MLIKIRQTWERNPRACTVGLEAACWRGNTYFRHRYHSEVVEMFWKSFPPSQQVFSGHGGANGLRDTLPLLGVESSTWKSAVNTHIPVIRKSAKVNLAKEISSLRARKRT